MCNAKPKIDLRPMIMKNDNCEAHIVVFLFPNKEVLGCGLTYLSGAFNDYFIIILLSDKAI